MKNLVEQIKINKLEKDKLVKTRKTLEISFQSFNNSIDNSKKTILEKLITIISLGIFNYHKKYDKQILDLKKKIILCQNNLDKINGKLQIINLKIEIQEEEFVDKINIFRDKMVNLQNYLEKAAYIRYVNEYERVELVQKINNTINGNENFLYYEKVRPFVEILIEFQNNSKYWVKEHNEIFIKREKIEEKDFFDNIESNPLTKTQQDAVLINENNNLVLAGAGSGKTSVIIAKVAYLIKKEIMHPSEILVLAFNKNAQKELEERFDKKNISVSVKTFHSFGLSVIAQELSQKLNLCPMTESQNNMTKFIKDTIHTLMASKDTFLENFLMFIAYFKIPYKNESDFATLGDYYDYQKNYGMHSLKHEVEIKGEGNENLITLKEETVKSHQELVLANFLTLNGIRYLYEEPYKYKTYTVEKRQYHPDFYLPDYDIYIEHFGIDRNKKTAPYVNNKEYLEGIEWKVNLHKEKETILIQTFSYEFSENKLLELLKEKLLKHNVIFRELEFSEIAELLKEPIENNEFTKLFTTFLNHYKSNRHNLDDLKEKSYDIERTNLFLKIFEFIYIEYKKFQIRNHCIDFDDMIVKALNTIEIGQYEHNFKHIFIDEFQDISTTRARLIKELLPLKNTSITAVGDDWQSINRFAGSNIQIIQDFEKVFGVSEVVALDYTFRFNNIVSNIASSFVQKNPHQIKKEIKTIKYQNLNIFSILVYWTTGDKKEDIGYILNLIAKKNIEKKTVMILARYNFIFKDIKRFKNKYSNLDIVFSTVHGSKGNEADYVVIMDINKGEFGFPSKIEDDPILDIVIPKGDDFEDAEERRLFYVALTRTKGTLFLLSDMYNKSVFIEELIKENKDEIFFLNDPKNKLENCPECKTGFLKKRISNNYNKYFYGCSNFPRCKYIENIHYCPDCKNETFKNKDKMLIECKSENCEFSSQLCKKCSGIMKERKGEYGVFLGCENYPKCTYTSK